MTDAERARWERETYEPAVRRAPERKPAFLAESGAEVAPLYGPPTLSRLRGGRRRAPVDVAERADR